VSHRSHIVEEPAAGPWEWAWQIRGRTLTLGPRTLVMGVVNVTPDSFSDGGRTFSVPSAVAHGLRLVAEGADLLDVGGESSRPGSAPVPAAEELERVLPVIRALALACDVPISIDTTKSEVAVAAIEAGARIVNDISGLRNDPDLARRIAPSGAGLVVTHMQGTPATMQASPVYADLIAEVLAGLAASLEAAGAAGIGPERVVVDPGIGFGKSVGHNLALLEHAGRFRALGRPVLIGASRKSFLGAVTGRAVGDRLAGSVAAATIAIRAGATIVRAHDVAATLDVARLADAVRAGEER
jgi:dihydropteroate synthase